MRPSLAMVMKGGIWWRDIVVGSWMREQRDLIKEPQIRTSERFPFLTKLAGLCSMTCHRCVLI